MPLKPLWLLLLPGLLLTIAYGQESFTFSTESLANGQAVELDKRAWKYSPDDDPRFADPQFDDRVWETLNGKQELMLAANDVVVLMSDGLPERFNPRDEMLDYERIFNALPALAHQSSEQIIAALIRLGDEWSEGRPQDDDVTFVVLKIK